MTLRSTAENSKSTQLWQSVMSCCRRKYSLKKAASSISTSLKITYGKLPVGKQSLRQCSPIAWSERLKYWGASSSMPSCGNFCRMSTYSAMQRSPSCPNMKDLKMSADLRAKVAWHQWLTASKILVRTYGWSCMIWLWLLWVSQCPIPIIKIISNQCLVNTNYIHSEFIWFYSFSVFGIVFDNLALLNISLDHTQKTALLLTYCQTPELHMKTNESKLEIWCESQRNFSRSWQRLAVCDGSNLLRSAMHCVRSNRMSIWCTLGFIKDSTAAVLDVKSLSLNASNVSTLRFWLTWANEASSPCWIWAKSPAKSIWSSDVSCKSASCSAVNISSTFLSGLFLKFVSESLANVRGKMACKLQPSSVWHVAAAMTTDYTYTQFQLHIIIRFLYYIILKQLDCISICTWI